MLTDRDRDRAERNERRRDRIRRGFKVRHMNNTKWREVLEVLAGLRPGVRTLRIKMIHEHNPRETSGGRLDVYEGWAEGWIGGFELRDIEWVEVRLLCDSAAGLAELADLRKSLADLGQLSVVESDTAIRIVGYE